MKDQEIVGGLRRIDNDWGSGYEIFCPGCRHVHYVAVEKPQRNGAQWTFNGNLQNPTFSPSLLVTTQAYKDDDFNIPATCCHSFIRNGQWEFLEDCTHELAGKTVPVPPHPATGRTP